MESQNEYLVKVSSKKVPKGSIVFPLSVAKYANVGYYIAIPLLASLAIGVMLDRYLHTKPFFTIVLICFGAVSTFYNIVTLLKEIQKSDAPHKH